MYLKNRPLIIRKYSPRESSDAETILILRIRKYAIPFKANDSLPTQV